MECTFKSKQLTSKTIYMNDFKSWLESKTIWAAVVVLAPALTRLVGFDVEATIQDIITIVGAASVIYFRIKASKLIKK